MYAEDLNSYSTLIDTSTHRKNLEIPQFTLLSIAGRITLPSSVLMGEGVAAKQLEVLSSLKRKAAAQPLSR